VGEGLLEDRKSLLEHYRSMRVDLLDAIDGLSDQLLSEASLDGWSVNDHLAHIALWDEIRASEMVRISAGQAPAWPHLSDEEGEAFNVITHGLRAGLTVAQVRWELAETHRRVLDAVASATERGLDGTLYGEAGLRGSHEAVHTGWIRRWRKEMGM
jgi:uncharacterized damage-inducible protein DinB